MNRFTLARLFLVPSVALALSGAATAQTPTVEFASPSQSGGEAGGALVATVQLSETSAVAVEVPYVVSGSATHGVDFTVSPNPVVVAPGTLSAPITITVLDDALDENAETVVLTLQAPTHGVLGTVVVHTATLVDDDPLPVLQFGRLRQRKEESDPPFSIPVLLSTVSGRTVSASLALTGDATSGVDYTLGAANVVIPAGSISGSVDVTLVDDLDSEGIEAVHIELRQPVNATVGSAKMHSTTILDNDGITPRPIVRPLAVSPKSLTFPLTRMGTESNAQGVAIQNVDALPLTVQALVPRGVDAAEFAVVPSVALPHTLQPGESLTAEVRLAPAKRGPLASRVSVVQSPRSPRVAKISVAGQSFGPTGAELRMRAGELDYTDSQSRFWNADYGYLPTGTTVATTAQPITGTSDPDLYSTTRRGAAISYAWELPNGTYEVVLHFVEPVKDTSGLRVFDVIVEGVLALDDVDVYDEVGKFAAYPVSTTVALADGTLNIDLLGSVSNALIAAVEVRSRGVLEADPGNLDFLTVEQGQFLTLPVTLENSGLHEARIEGVSFVVNASGQGSGRDFSVDIGGTVYAGADKSVSHDGVDFSIPAGGSAVFDVTFAPTYHADHVVGLGFSGDTFDPVELALTGTGGANADWGFLHPVIDVRPSLVVDYEGDNVEPVDLLGAESHTHEPGHTLASFDWKAGGVSFASTADTARTLGLGATEISLTIGDDNVPASTATETAAVIVHRAARVPGILASYFAGSDPMALLDAVPANPDWIERLPEFLLTDQNGKVGTTPFAGSVMVVWEAEFAVAASASYDFAVSGGAGHRIFVNDAPFVGPKVYGPGRYDLEVRVAIPTVGHLPVSLAATIGGVPARGFSGLLVHDERDIVPTIHDMPTAGIDVGGNVVTIAGFGFWPKSQVVVHWGSQNFDHTTLESIAPERIELITPPGSGTINVTVETLSGVSKPRQFTYSPGGPVPINFVAGPSVPAAGVTTGEWGPDGRFYVGLISGEIKAITFDGSYNATSVQTYTGVSGLSNSDVLGITFNPYDPPSPVKIYVAHGQHFLNGGGSFTGPSPYTGQVSVLTGPAFHSPQPLITKLPTSNHDHAINGMVFDENGDLLIGVGGNTNAGVKWPLIGDLPESPLSAAIVLAHTSRPDFDGALNYVETDTGITNNDQVYGGIVDLAPGTHVEVYASGLRNPFDLVYTTWRYLYATDNGPNSNFGPASTGATTDSGQHPTTPDELVLLDHGNYYGHPNRSRGRYDPRQNVYRHTSAPAIPGEFSKQLAIVESSTNGIVEYRARTFNSQMRGNLLVQKWNFRPRRVELTAGRRGVVQVTDIFPHQQGLDVNVGPGGAILSMDYSGSAVHTFLPDDVSAVGLTVQDIFPWRAPAGGGTPFVIGGQGFGALGDTSVTIGGIPATLSSVTPTRIRGMLPANPSPPSGLVDVQVNVGVTSRILTQAFHWMPPAPGGANGFWIAGASMPDPLGEVACGVIGGKMYVVGEGTGKTYAYDLQTGTWASTLATRPFAGNHHGAEVVGGKLYLVGGLTSGGGLLQIYDPVANSWTTGAAMPWSGGSVATCAIGGQIYAAGGIVGSGTVVNAARYDPVANGWTALPNMPVGVNHAAAATDGTDFWVFGGRQGGNVPQPGFTVVQVYRPATNTWEASGVGGSALSPMPEGRGGTGRAVWYRGEFYVFGGETSNAADPSATPNRVFPQVFAYDPLANTWRQDADMPTPRHGIYPVLYQGRVFVAAGGVVFGFSSSPVLEIFQR